MLLALIKICLLCDVRQNEAYHASFEKNQNLNYRWESLSSYCQNFELYGGQIDFITSPSAPNFPLWSSHLWTISFIATWTLATKPKIISLKSIYQRWYSTKSSQSSVWPISNNLDKIIVIPTIHNTIMITWMKLSMGLSLYRGFSLR
jgi:hypothetical protein